MIKSFLQLSVFVFLFSCATDGAQESSNKSFEKGDYEEAIKAYTEQLSTNHENVNALYNRGRAYQELKKYDEAIKDYTHVLKINEKHIDAHLSLATLYYDSKEYNKSLVESNKAIKLNDGAYKAYYLKARAEHHMGYSEESMESYNTAININKEYGEAFLYRGALKVSMQIKSACDDFTKADRLGVKGAKEAFQKYCQR